MPFGDLHHLRKNDLAGCGQHVEQVMRGVPPADRCPGHTQGGSALNTPEHAGGGWWRRMFGQT